MSSPLARNYRRLLRIAARIGVPRVVPRIVRRLPHDRSAFTQGLVCHQGVLYESTGKYGESCLQAIDLKTGVVMARHPLPDDRWGEGIAVLNNHLVQLTWRSRVAYVYSLPDLHVVDQYHYEGQGWGLSKWKDCFVMSDGSSLLKIMNERFDVVRDFSVCSNRISIRGLNDLQVVNDTIHANVYYRSEVLGIDIATGTVGQIVDCGELIRLAMPKADGHILNGIAYDEEEGVFYLTGKHWSDLFVVEIPTTTWAERKRPGKEI